jgi:hypothetical protein
LMTGQSRPAASQIPIPSRSVDRRAVSGLPTFGWEPSLCRERLDFSPLRRD